MLPQGDSAGTEGYGRGARPAPAGRLEGMTRAGASPETLVRRGFVLEYATLCWNVAGLVVLAIAALSARSVALAGFGLDSLIEIGASTVVIWELSGAGEERQRQGLRLIGYAFAILAAYLLVQSTVVLAAGVSPAPLPARYRLDRGDRGRDVRPGRREDADRPGPGQPGAADRGPGHDDRRDPRHRGPAGADAQRGTRLVVGRPGGRRMCWCSTRPARSARSSPPVTDSATAPERGQRHTPSAIR